MINRIFPDHNYWPGHTGLDSLQSSCSYCWVHTTTGLYMAAKFTNFDHT